MKAGCFLLVYLKNESVSKLFKSYKEQKYNCNIGITCWSLHFYWGLIIIPFNWNNLLYIFDCWKLNNKTEYLK